MAKYLEFIKCMGRACPMRPPVGFLPVFSRLDSGWVDWYRRTSLLRNRRPPWDRHRSLGMVLL